MDFSQWTREDFIAFDTRRQEVFQPTPEEIALHEQAVEQAKLSKVTAVLANYGFTLPEVVDKDFCLQFAEAINAKQFVGEDVSGWIDGQQELYGSYKEGLISIINNYF